MARTGIALDDIAEIDDFSDRTLLEVADRLERSTTFQEFIAREIELDEVFRRVETGIKAMADEPWRHDERGRLEVVFGLVTRAHDLAGEGKPLEAAARLREAVRGANLPAGSSSLEGQNVPSPRGNPITTTQ